MHCILQNVFPNLLTTYITLQENMEYGHNTLHFVILRNSLKVEELPKASNVSNKNLRCALNYTVRKYDKIFCCIQSCSWLWIFIELLTVAIHCAWVVCHTLYSWLCQIEFYYRFIDSYLLIQFMKWLEVVCIMLGKFYYCIGHEHYCDLYVQSNHLQLLLVPN